MTASKSSARIIAAAFYLSLFAISCAQLLGEITIDGDGTVVETNLPGDGGSSEPTGPVIVCEGGVTRCDGRVLQLCRDDGTGWTFLQACATPELCESSELSTVSACLTPQCAEEQMSCDGSVLRRCNAARTGWEEFDTCESAAHCDAGKRQCLPAPCNPGDRRCNVGNLERCNDERTDWEQLDECVTNELCEATLAPLEVVGGTLEGAPAPDLVGAAEGPTECRSPVCVPREVKCVGVRLEACNEGQTDWFLAEECATPVLCDASITYTGLRGSPRCVRPTCAAGEHRCSELGVLEVCNENRDGYTPIEQCIGPQFCNSVAADNGQPGCEAAPCEAGVQQCNGPQIQVCRQNRTGFDPLGAPCETRGLCNDDNPAAFCAAPVCQRGPLSTNEFVCRGATLQRCNDQHTAYDVQNTCATAGLCNAALGFNGCVAPVCAVGETRCNGDFVQVCNAQRTGFDNIERCAAGTCDSALRRCADPCVLGTARCNAQGGLEECRDPLVGRQVTALCGSPQLCDAQARSCRTPPAGCTADGVRRCRVQGSNRVLEVCSEGRSRFSLLDTCSPTEFCDVNDITCDTCNQTSQPTCEGNTLVTCAANGQSASRQECAFGCQVVEPGADRCRTCLPGSVSCDGAQLLVCRQRGGEEFLAREPCDTQALCRQTIAACNANGTGEACRCQDVCDPGDRDCRGAQPVVCNADQTAFVASGNDCGLEENCNPIPVGACFPCGRGDVRCGADEIMEGCRSDRSGFVDLDVSAGEVRCINDNTGEFSQRCIGARLVEERCESPLTCVEGAGCVECDDAPGQFPSTCAPDGSAARRVCIRGNIELQACPTASGCLTATCSGAGSCDTASAPAGTACQRAPGVTGVCDGAPSPSCVECVSAAQHCNDGVACTVDTCQANGSCRHTATNSLCDDGLFCNGGETCTAAGGCSPGQPPACTDTNQCTANSCDETANTCVVAPLSGGACTRSNPNDGVCRAGVCSPICTPGAGQCVQASFQVCNEAGTAFVEQDRCDSAALCSAAGCAEPCAGLNCAFGCDVGTNTCVLCTADRCTVGPNSCSTSACSADRLSCVTTAQCPQQLCVQGVCRQCVNANQCPDGQTCSDDNQCVPLATCNPAVTCATFPVGPCERRACGGPDGLTCVAQAICQNGEICVADACVPAIPPVPPIIQLP